MKVRELIELLEKYDGEKEVYVDDSRYPFEPLEANGIVEWDDDFILISQSYV